MADSKPSPASRPNEEVRRSDAPSGVTHVRTYQSGTYTVVGNHLAQHHELSLTAIGLAAHIFSLPEGSPVDIRSLTDRFPEGRDRITFALRELETHGYLARVRERTENGRLFIRTYAHHTPGAASSSPAPAAPVGLPSARSRGKGAAVRRSGDDRQAPQEDDRGTDRATPPAPAPPAPAPPASAPPAPVAKARQARQAPVRPAPLDARHDRAVALLAGLRRTDDRLVLTQRDLLRLAPAVTAWFDRGASALVVHRALTDDLPQDMRYPAGVLGYRLRELLPAALPAVPAPRPVTDDIPDMPRRPHRFQDCDGCDRPFRAPEPGLCRDCRPGGPAVPASFCAA
ncbi:helix-turn-helix domain-containing protein [Streptomyces sp. NPDC093094]|uniref:helix-turn-helix domain-containing protein n=1 Tax=Streptomyces sp. NPDC093094 TaxID=3366026 RepID=UPI00382BD71B